MTAGNNMLAIDDIHLAIGHTPILNGVSLAVEEGTTVGLIGPNGSGKTTLFNCISGFHHSQKGSIAYHGKDITKMVPYERSALGIGRVFQNNGIFREMSLQENVVTSLEGRQSLWRTFFPWSAQNAANRREARKYLQEVGLEEKRHDKAGSLSGGQMRLLEIVRTLAFGADFFLLDEPTAGVSPKMKGDVAALIRRLQELGKTVFVIEHDMLFIRELCDRIVVLDVGRVVLDGTPEQVQQSSLLQEIYFGSTATNGS